MNDFSFIRTGQLIKKQWVENKRFYTMSVLALMGLLAVAFTIWLVNDGRHYEEDIIYGTGLTGLFITGAIFASTSFNMLNSKDSGIYWISFPASHFEKLLAVLFFNVVVFTIVYFSCFHLLKFAADAYIHSLIQDDNSYSYSKVDWTKKGGFGDMLPYFIYAFFAVQAAYLLGAASFKKLPFIITTVAATAVIFITTYYFIKLYEGVIPKGYSYQLTNITDYSKDGVYKQYNMNSALKTFIEVFLKYLLAPFLWLVTWFKLKEKEI